MSADAAEAAGLPMSRLKPSARFLGPARAAYAWPSSSMEAKGRVTRGAGDHWPPG